MVVIGAEAQGGVGDMEALFPCGSDYVFFYSAAGHVATLCVCLLFLYTAGFRCLVASDLTDTSIARLARTQCSCQNIGFQLSSWDFTGRLSCMFFCTSKEAVLPGSRNAEGSLRHLLPVN